MPEKDGKLTDAEREIAAAWLKEKNPNIPCPLCGSHEWGIGEKLGLIPLSTNVFSFGAGYPVVVVICANCAYTRVHNAIRMGVAPTDEERKAKAAEEKKAEAKNG